MSFFYVLSIILGALAIILNAKDAIRASLIIRDKNAELNGAPVTGSGYSQPEDILCLSRFRETRITSIVIISVQTALIIIMRKSEYIVPDIALYITILVNNAYIHFGGFSKWTRSFNNIIEPYRRRYGWKM